MRVLGFFLLAFLGVFALNAGQASAQSTTETEKPYGKKVVVIKEGDTLTKIADENKTTYPRLFDANTKIENPDVIHPGDKVRIPHPKEELKHREIVAPAPVVQTYVQPQPQASASQNTTYVPPTPAPQVSSSNVDGGVWDRLASCESGGNWAINTGNGYYGGLQFNLGTWQSNGGTGYPHQASKAEQIRVAENLRAARGFSPWPACSAQLGLR